MPTDVQVDRALELIQKSGGNYQYFFEKLTSPAWIEPLAKKGRFAQPPGIERVGTMYRFPRWPEGDYLFRMAPIAPDAVAAALSDKCFESDNPLVHLLLVEIGTALPGPLAVPVARREQAWVDTQSSLFPLYPEKAAALVEHLCLGHEARAALGLASAILEVRAPAEREGKLIEGEDGTGYVWKPSPDPLGKMEPVRSQLFLRRVIEPLANAVPADLLASLARILDHAVSIHASNQQDRLNDYSDIWRPYLEHSSHHDTLSETVSALIAAIKVVVDRGQDGIGLVFDAIQEYTWPIFDRIRAFTLLCAANPDQADVERFVNDPEHYGRPSINPEFKELLKKVAPSLASAVLNDILQRIDAGPDPTSYAYHLEHRVQPEHVETVRSQIIEQWKRDWLFPLSDALDGARAEELKALVMKYDAPGPRFRSGGFRQLQDQSPSDVTGFNAMTVDELVGYLKEWAPPSSGLPFERPSRAGMAATLRQWVVHDPQRATANLESFLTTDLNPAYITAILDAFSGMLKSEQTFDIYAVARAAQWVAENTDALTDFDTDRSLHEATWNWAQMSAARYMTDLLLQEKRLDLSRAAELWPAVRAMCYLDRPTVEDEVEYKKKASRYASYALNTPRPVGIEAMIRYGRWLKLATHNADFSSELMVPVFEVLEEKLDARIEPSVAVREMFGMQFRTLAWLDLKRFSEVIPKLFPGKDGELKEQKTLDRFAWHAYLQYGGLVIDMLPAMRNRYLMAIKALQQTKDSDWEMDRALANHLMEYYAHGAIELGDPLITQFFESASPKLRAQAAGDIGWRLGQETGPLDETIQGRLMRLFESRMQLLNLDSKDEADELATFGWWLGSGKFPEAWSVTQAMLILERIRSLRPDFAVVEALHKLAPRYPYEAVRIVRVLFEDDKDGWAIHGWDQHLDSILRQALDDGEAARKEAREFIELLVSRGFRGYRSLTAHAGHIEPQH